MKNTIKRFAVALAAAFIALTIGGDVIAATKQDSKTKMSAKKENELLKAELDSLKSELERYRQELYRSDSIATELINIYEGEKAVPSEVNTPIEYTTEVSDSLLNLWYAHKLVNEENIETIDMDSVKFESNVPDSVYLERIAKMNSFITLPYNDIVKNYIIKYSEKMPTAMGRMIGLCDYYMPIFQEILNK